MELFRGIQNLNRPLSYAVVTIGNFDGVHHGHRKIMTEVIARARAHHGTACVYTFRPHPQEALRPGNHIQLLSTYDEKLEILGSLGIDVVVEEPFGPEFFSLTPENFFDLVLKQKFQAAEIVVGHDFAFGKERQGDIPALAKFCQSAGIALTIVPAQKLSQNGVNVAVSSSLIRENLLSCHIEEANQLLGRRFSYRGVVVRGDQRGRTLGFPTANLKLENKLALPHGVYATISRVEMNKVVKDYPSVTNVGTRPTFQPTASELPVVVESHLLDVTLDLYGHTLEVQFLKHLRAEKRFTSSDELKAQINLDAELARGTLRQLSDDKI